MELKNIKKSFNAKEVLNDISATMESGAIYGISGENGAGKSVLLKIILGLIRPDSGSVFFKSEHAGSSIKIGAAIDGAELFTHMNAFDNLLYLSKFRKEIDKNRICEVLKMVGLDAENKAKIKKYSEGMKKRLIIAQAIMEENDLLVFDEPTGNLDAEAVKLVHSIIKEERNKGSLIILTSHDEKDLNSLCDHVFELKEGILV